MKNKKKQQVVEQLERIEKCLANAEQYLARGVNIEGSTFLHLDDWQGKSGHPLWMKNFMIPTTTKARARKESILDKMDRKAKQKKLCARRKREQ